MATVNLSWTPASGSNVTEQRIYRGLDSNSLSLLASGLSPTANSYSDTTVTDSTRYYYMVQSICTIGGPTDSDIVSILLEGASLVPSNNLLVIPNSPPQDASDNIVESLGTLSDIMGDSGFNNPISDGWSVMGWWRADHNGSLLLDTGTEDIADTALFAVQDGYGAITDYGRLAIYREADPNGDHLTIDIKDNVTPIANKIRYRFLLSSGSNSGITNISSVYPYWDNNYKDLPTYDLVHIAVIYDPSASLLQRVRAYWNGQALTLTSAPYNAVPAAQNWNSTNKKLVLGWAEDISVGYSNHVCGVSVDELAFYSFAIDSNSALIGYNGGIITKHSTIPGLSAPTLEWSFENNGSGAENGNNAAAEFSLTNPGSLGQWYGITPYIHPINILPNH